MADIKRADSDTDPTRCQGIMSKGQCSNKAVDGSTFCEVHGGNKAVQATEQQQLSNYRLTKWQSRMEQKANTPQIKSLRDEIGILRILLEERLNNCTTGMDLILSSQPIADLVGKVEHVVTACHKLEEKLNVVIDRQQLLQFASGVIDIVGHHTAENQLQAISDEILQYIGKIGGDDNAD